MCLGFLATTQFILQLRHTQILVHLKNHKHKQKLTPTTVPAIAPLLKPVEHVTGFGERGEIDAAAEPEAACSR